MQRALVVISEVGGKGAVQQSSIPCLALARAGGTLIMQSPRIGAAAAVSTNWRRDARSQALASRSRLLEALHQLRNARRLTILSIVYFGKLFASCPSDNRPKCTSQECRLPARNDRSQASPISRHAAMPPFVFPCIPRCSPIVIRHKLRFPRSMALTAQNTKRTVCSQETHGSPEFSPHHTAILSANQLRTEKLKGKVRTVQRGITASGELCGPAAKRLDACCRLQILNWHYCRITFKKVDLII